MGSRGGRIPPPVSPLCLPIQWGNVGASCERALHVLPSLRPVGYEDAKGEPDGRCRVATDDVAEVMCAEVDPAEPDEQDQDRKYGNGGPPWKIGPRYPGKQVSQKSIGDERSHGVPAGKTPTRRRHPGIRKLGTKTPEDAF